MLVECSGSNCPGTLRAAVLCTGPSLKVFLDDPPRYDAVIGVNRAVKAFPCDWWVFADPELFVAVGPLGSPGRCTSREAFLRLRDEPRWGAGGMLGGPWRYWSEAAARRFAAAVGPAGPLRSMHFALLLADGLGAQWVDVFGADWSGTADWDGRPGMFAGKGRSEKRWADERAMFAVLVDGYLADQGMRVRRVEEKQPP